MAYDAEKEFVERVAKYALDHGMSFRAAERRLRTHPAERSADEGEVQAVMKARRCTYTEALRTIAAEDGEIRRIEDLAAEKGITFRAAYSLHMKQKGAT